MDVLSAGRVEMISEAFRKRAAVVERTADERWRIELHNGKPFSVEAWLDESWLVAAVEVAGIRPDHYWDIVRMNGLEMPLVRFALSPAHGAAHLRAELPLSTDWDEEAADGSRYVSVLCAGFEAAMVLLDGIGGAPACFQGDEDEAPSATIDLASLCLEAGWEGVSRPGGRLVVDLNLRRRSQASLTPAGTDGVRVSVDLGGCRPTSSTGRMAAAGLLLSATGHVRMARAVVGEVNGADRARLEVVFGACPRPEELNRALQALVIASDLTILELQALSDERVAQQYVVSREWAVERRSNRRGKKSWEHRKSARPLISR